jgi:aminomethyltransferase
MAQRTPLYDWHVAHGGRMVDFAGWDMPVQYSTITQEHEAVRTSAGLFDISHMGRLTFEGQEAEGFLQKIFTNDVAAMKPGQARYGLICNESGGILDDVLVYRLPKYWMMVVNASNRDKILGWIEKHRPMTGMAIKDRTHDWAMIAIQGPRAVAVTAPIMPEPQKLKYYYAEVVGSGDNQTILSRTGYTGEDGFEVIVPANRVGGLVDEIMTRSNQDAGSIRPCGLGARDTLRLEAAMPLYGHELTEAIDPLQAELGWAVKMNKGDFIGRQALEKRSKDQSRKKRIGLELEGKRIAREGANVLADGAVIGQVTSGTFAPTLAKAIAMAYVDPARSGIGTPLEVDVRGKAANARVVEMPFYRRKKT